MAVMGAYDQHHQGIVDRFEGIIADARE